MDSDDILDRFLNEIGKSQKPLPTGDQTVDRLPAVFVIDRSGSTESSGDIRQINEFLQRFAREVSTSQDDGWTSVRTHLDLAVVAYANSAETILPWTPGDQIRPDLFPRLSGDGVTSMAAGLELAATLMMQRLADYRRRQVSCYRGYIFNVTDGNPTDMSPKEDAQKIARWNRVKSVMDRFETISSQGAAYASTFHCTSQSADRALLAELSYTPDRVFDLDINNFDKLFEFIRVSLVMAADGEV